MTSEHAAATYRELCRQPGVMTLPLILPEDGRLNPLAAIGILPKEVIVDARETAVWDDEVMDAADSEAAWPGNEAGGDGFGASVASASTYQPKKRLVTLIPAQHGQYVPAAVALVGERSLDAALWMLLELSADEILVLQALGADRFVPQILERYDQYVETGA